MQGKHQYQPKLFSVVQIESLIPKNHLLVKLDQQLDLSFVRTLTAELYSHGTGRPSIDPEVFVRMLLIEHLYDIPSDRQLCEELGFNLAFRWFCRFSLEDRIPEHSSMTRIRDRLGEKTFEQIFVHVLRICEQKGLVKGKRVMTDGSLIRANAALKSLKERKRPDQTTPTGGGNTDGAKANPEPSPCTDTVMKAEVEAAAAQGESSAATSPDQESSSKSIKGKTFSNKTHVSKTDPDATLAGKKTEAKKLYYNLHQSVDPEHRVIIDCHITTGAVPDGTVYIERLEHFENALGYKIEEATADRGYGYGENLQYLKDRGIRSYVPRFHKDAGDIVDREKTPYDEAKDEFRCELGNRLTRSRSSDEGVAAYRPASGTCIGCERQPWCLIRRSGLRMTPYHQVQRETRLTEQTAEFKARRKERMWKVEGLFAESKFFHGLGRARYRDKWKVQVQAYLVASVQNLKRLMAVGPDGLISILFELAQLEVIENIFRNSENFRTAEA